MSFQPIDDFENIFLSPWSIPKNPDINFPIAAFERLINELGWADCSDWLCHWNELSGPSLSKNIWPRGTRTDWIWGIGLPLLSDIERFLSFDKEQLLFGLSGLPGSGKTSLGVWLEAASKELGWPIAVISLDDFYLCSNEMIKAMNGNPWGVPRGLPGSHSIELLQETINRWLETGELLAPQFDKSLRNGLGERSGWRRTNPIAIVIEGWFLSCSPVNSNLEILNKEEQVNPKLTTEEQNYRKIAQSELYKYLNVWNKLHRVWHLKAVEFSSTCNWKKQQEENMSFTRGSSLKGESLNSFIRMINTAIPQESLNKIKADVVCRINAQRHIEWVGTKLDELRII